MTFNFKNTLLLFRLLACLLFFSTAAKAAPAHTYATDTANVQAPVFPGGERELMRYMAKNVRYPVQAFTSKTVGSVVVQATIDTNGKIRNSKVVHRSKAVLEAEVLGVVRRMPK